MQETQETGLIPGWGRSPGGGNGNSLQCSCLENPRDGRAWWAAIYGAAWSRTLLKRLSSLIWLLHVATINHIYQGEKGSPRILEWVAYPIVSSLPGSPIPGILQARTLEWVAISFSNAWKWKVKVKLLSHVWLRDPMDCSLPGSSTHGIFQARVLEWGAIAFSGEAHSSI